MEGLANLHAYVLPLNHHFSPILVINNPEMSFQSSSVSVTGREGMWRGKGGVRRGMLENGSGRYVDELGRGVNWEVDGNGEGRRAGGEGIGARWRRLEQSVEWDTRNGNRVCKLWGKLRKVKGKLILSGVPAESHQNPS